MDVKEFVSSTILQIMEGVADTQERARQLGGYVNPTPLDFKGPAHTGTTASGLPIYAIDFDIAIAAMSEAEKSAGAKVQVASIISIGAKGAANDKLETTSRVKFAVHVTMPMDTASTDEKAAKKAADDAKIRNRSTTAITSAPGGWMG